MIQPTHQLVRAMTLASCFLIATPALAQEQVRALVQAKTITRLSSQIDAQILELPVANGESFKKGEPLVKLDCQHYQLALKRAEASLGFARQNFLNKKELTRLKSAGAMELSLAKAEESIAKADVNMARLPVENCVVTAPFHGKITEQLVDPYQFVSTGEELIEVLDSQTFEIRLIVPSQWITWLKPGSLFTVRIDELDSEHQARVLRLGSLIEAVSQTVVAIAEFVKRPEGIVSGMSGTALFDRE